MNSRKPNGRKEVGLERFKKSWINSFEGLIYAYKNEQSLWLHAAGTIVIIVAGFILKITFNQWAILICALVEVLSVELLNSAIEATVDLVTHEFHPLAKIAKDCGSAATFVSTMMLIIISLFIFVPKVMYLL